MYLPLKCALDLWPFLLQNVTPNVTASAMHANTASMTATIVAIVAISFAVFSSSFCGWLASVGGTTVVLECPLASVGLDGPVGKVLFMKSLLSFSRPTHRDGGGTNGSSVLSKCHSPGTMSNQTIGPSCWISLKLMNLKVSVSGSEKLLISVVR